MKKKYMTLTIKGLDWKIYVQTPSAYKRQHGSDSAAITYYDDREVFFKTDHLKFGSCMHELLHALVYSSGTISTGMSGDQMEELILGLLEEHYFEIGDWTRKVLDYVAKK